MAQVLSQDEVDALLKGIGGGDVDTKPKETTDASGISQYSLTSQDRIVRGRLPGLEMLHDRFCRGFRTSMSNMLRRPVDVTVLNNENVKYGEFMRTVPVPTSLHVFKIEPLKGYALLVIEGRLVFSLIDIFFGGSGASPYRLEGRDFTTIEQRIIRKIALTILGNYQVAWKPIYEIHAEWSRAESNPQFANICLASDDVVAIQCEVDLEDAQGKLSFIIPYSSIEPIKDKLKSGYQMEGSEIDNLWQTRFRQQMRDVFLQLCVELGRTWISGRDLLQLRVGDIITLDQDVSDPVSLYLEDVMKFKGYLGTYHGHQSLKISSIVELQEQGDD